MEKEGDATRRDGDPKTEINKLFSKLKSSSSSSSRLEPGKSTRPRGWREVGRRPKSPSAASVGHATRDAVVEVLKELNAWPVLLKFCGELPVLGVLGKDKAFLSGCVGEGAHSLETLIERYSISCRCVYIQWNLSILYTRRKVLFSDLASFQGGLCGKGVLFREVSSVCGCSYRGVPHWFCSIRMCCSGVCVCRNRTLLICIQ